MDNLKKINIKADLDPTPMHCGESNGQKTVYILLECNVTIENETSIEKKINLIFKDFIIKNDQVNTRRNTEEVRSFFYGLFCTYKIEIENFVKDIYEKLLKEDSDKIFNQLNISGEITKEESIKLNFSYSE